jgi:hypothetical protein
MIRLISARLGTKDVDNTLFIDFQMNSIGFKFGEYGGR